MTKLLLILPLTIVMLSACDRGIYGTKEFRFPPGDTQKGEQVFVANNCLSCHLLEGYEEPARTTAREINPPIKLGGDIRRTVTYAELLTSIINPSHKLAKGYAPAKIQKNGESLMRNYNDVMTVTELADLVTFLETYYEFTPYEPGLYQGYYP